MPSKITDILKQKILLADGAMGSLVQAMNLQVTEDYLGHENCTDILCLSRPDVVFNIHKSYLQAGANIITTNSFGAAKITLAEFGLADKCFEINKAAAEIAKKAIVDYANEDNFVMGGIGPGTKLPSLLHVSYDELYASFLTQCEGLIAGGIDVFLMETCQDLLQIKTAINAAKAAMKSYGVTLPIFVQVSIETNGSLLTGSDIKAVCESLKPMGIDLLGLNCATGPREMEKHLQYLSSHWHKLISVQPNAGLPELIDAKTHYPLDAKELASWQQYFIENMGVNLIGGCCGTTPEHIKALREMLNTLAIDSLPARQLDDEVRAASIYTTYDYFQENAFFSIGERCNANGSKKFRDMQKEENWQGCIDLAIEQEKEGSHAIDLCCAHVDRNEKQDMCTLMEKMATAVSVPIVVDSTQSDVIEEALKRYGAKAIINSVNLEDGEESAKERLELAKKYGSSIIALTIDEQGMAKTAERKVAIAERLINLACHEMGFNISDILIDPLTFTIATGNKDDENLAIETLNAIAEIRKRWPKVQIVLGLSNISFGLNMAARHVLNSVFLHHAIKAGMSGAIVHMSKIMPLHKIDEQEITLFEDLIFNNRFDGYDPLSIILEKFADRKVATQKINISQLPLDERIKQRIIDGNLTDIERDLDEALANNIAAIDIINDILLDGMKVVGELFGSGKMQLPFVLKSAETMKAAVSYLENFMDKKEHTSRGKIVLATVKGDVHDIGKNLVDIILSNNGFEVINLGIRQEIEDIVAAVKTYDAKAIGMSGLLVRSAIIMKENLQYMNTIASDIPVILGGAALTRRFVNEDCASSYNGAVFYAKDAFAGLKIMEDIAANKLENRISKQQKKVANKEVTDKERVQNYLSIKQSQIKPAKTMTPPFWGSRHVQNVPVANIMQYLNMRMLFRFHLADKTFKQGVLSKEQQQALAYMKQICAQENMFQPQAIYGYWPCVRDNDKLIILDTENQKNEILSIPFLRQQREDGISIADFFADKSSAQVDVLAMQVVTIGQKASTVANQWLLNDRYQDYLYAHSLSVELTEALAEHIHAKIRQQLNISQHDAKDVLSLLNKGYQGARWSFGYPACPDIEQQRQLLELMGAHRIGVSMDENLQMHPEQTTMAIISAHPQADYFAV